MKNILRLEHLNNIPKVRVICWGNEYQSDSWRVEIDLSTEQDKFEINGKGSTLDEAAGKALVKYDIIIKASPEFNPNMTIEGPVTHPEDDYKIPF